MGKNKVLQIDEAYYDNHYENIHYQGSLGRYSKWIHRSLESGLGKNDVFDDVLEIGAGQGEHLRFVNHKFKKYVCSDIREPNFKQNDDRVITVQADAEDLKFGDSSFDRILNVCVLHHLSNPSQALSELRRVVKGGGLISIYLPCDPGLVYRWVRHPMSHLKQKRQMGINMRAVKYLWANEHKSHYLAIKFAIAEIFQNDTVIISRRPFPLLSWNFNLFTVFQIRVSKN